MEDVRLKKLKEEKEKKEEELRRGDCDIFEYGQVSQKYIDRLDYLNSLNEDSNGCKTVTITLEDEDEYGNISEEKKDNYYLRIIPKVLEQLVDGKKNFVHVRAYNDGTVHVDKEGHNTLPVESIIFDLSNIDESQRMYVVSIIRNLTFMYTGESKHYLDTVKNGITVSGDQVSISDYYQNLWTGVGKTFYNDKSGGLYPEGMLVKQELIANHSDILFNQPNIIMNNNSNIAVHKSHK